MDVTNETRLSRHNSASIVQNIFDELATLESISKRMQDRSSVRTPPANSALTALAGSKSWTGTSTMSIIQWIRGSLSSGAPLATAARALQDLITALNTSVNIISNQSNNPINIIYPSEPDPVSHWMKSDDSRKAFFDEARIFPYSKPMWISFDTLYECEPFCPKLFTTFDTAYPSNEPKPVYNGNHWRREAAVSRHMDSSRSKYRISQVMASINTNASWVFERCGTH